MHKDDILKEPRGQVKVVSLPKFKRDFGLKEGGSMIDYIFGVVYLLILYRIVKEIK